MTKRHPENERIKRRYVLYLKDAKGRGDAVAAIKAEADRAAGNVLPIIAEIRKSGATTLRAIAEASSIPDNCRSPCRVSISSSRHVVARLVRGAGTCRDSYMVPTFHGRHRRSNRFKSSQRPRTLGIHTSRRHTCRPQGRPSPITSTPYQR